MSGETWLSIQTYLRVRHWKVDCRLCCDGGICGQVGISIVRWGTETTFVSTTFLMSWLGEISLAPGVLWPGTGFKDGSGRSHCSLCLTLISPLFSFWYHRCVLLCLESSSLGPLWFTYYHFLKVRQERVVIWLHRGGEGSSVLFNQFSCCQCHSASLPFLVPPIPEPFLGSMERLSLLQFGIRQFDFRFLFSFKPVSTSSSAFHLPKFVNISCLL